MTDATPATTQTVVVAPQARSTWKDWLPVISLLVIIGGVLLTAGGVLRQVNDNTLRIDKLEIRADQRDVQLGDLRMQMAGANAKLDLLVNRTGGSAK